MNLQPIKIAILAMGGEGGGVLADWIVDLAETAGQVAQSTSVPGVAQRTGATVYYVELFAGPARDAEGRPAVLALMPMAGDVDVVLASELMEAGRAVQRGFVTPERTTLVASTHRVYSIAEKIAMGDGRVDSAQLLEACRAAAKRSVCFDMEHSAASAGSVLSAVLFGALCGVGVLPFSRAEFEATIQRGGIGVERSLRAFGLGHDEAKAPASIPAAQAEGIEAGRDLAKDLAAAAAAATPATVSAAVARLLARIEREFDPALNEMLRNGIRRLIDYQDPAYAELYLDRLARLQAEPGASDLPLLRETARHLALWMSYEDTIRVADLKTRAARFARVHGEVRADAAQLLDIVEFMHPRLEEICDTLPAPLGRWLAKPHGVHRLMSRATRSGREIKTSSLRGFLLLFLIAGLRRWRRITLRYAVETARIEAWLRRIAASAGHDPALALDLALCQRLVKGYGDTHARGLKNFDLLMEVVDRHRRLAPATLGELRGAALADEQGRVLREKLQHFGLA